MSRSEASVRLQKAPAASDSDVEFLKEQVQRLSAVLSQYQKKYRSLDSEPEVPLATGGPYASWLSNKKLLVPLLAEYDLTISDLQQQLSHYQAEVTSFAAKMEQITQENTRLHSELRKSLETQLQAAAVGGGGGSGVQAASAALDALQQQADTATKERDSYIELWKRCSSELEAAQRSNQEKSKTLLKYRTELANTQKAVQACDELQAACQELDKEREQCLRTAREQGKELAVLQESLSQHKVELRAATTKNSQLRSSLDEITLQLKRREAERLRTEQHDDSMDERLHLLQLTSTDLEAKLLAVQRESALLKGDKTDLEERLAALQSKTSSLEQRECEAMLHVKESMQLVENALLEKEQGQIREQQLSGEVARLKAALAAIVHEAGERTKQEVNAVRDECNKSIDKMAEEIEKLERECGQRRAHTERVEREKKVLGVALETARAAVPLETARSGESLQGLHARLCAAERTRDEALGRLEAAGACVKRLEASLKGERCAGQRLAEEELARRRQLQAENQEAKQQRITLMSQYDEMQQKLRSSELAREVAERRLSKELAVLSQRQEHKEKELLVRLDGSEEAHRKSTQELRDLLAAQHRVGTRWREEAQSLAGQLEQTEAKLRSQVASHKRRSEELSRLLKQSRAKHNEVSQQLAGLNGVQAVLQQELGEAESQLSAAVTQVSQLLAQEKQLLQERRETHRQLDLLRLQVARNAGITIGAGELTEGSVPNHYSAHSAGGPAHLPARHPHSSSSSSRQPYATKPGPPPPHDNEAGRWSSALSELRHSIRQVREDIGLNGSRLHATAPSMMEGSRAHSRHRLKPSPPSPLGSGGEEEEGGGMSEHSSVLLRDDLSHHSQS